MKIFTIQPVSYESNVFILTGDDKNAILIDCSDERDYGECVRIGLNPKAVLLTHGHLDHIAGCKHMQEQCGARIMCGEGEEDFIFSGGNRSIFGVDIPKFTIDRTLKDGEELELYGLKIKAISTPGHTVGGVCYVIEDCIFSGDTLFCGSVGRCDFPTGDERELIKSLKKLDALKGNYTVYCGHGGKTTLDSERKNNPFMRLG